MRRAVTALLALSLLAAGCGEDDGGDKTFNAVAAAEATRGKGTARMTMTMRVSGLGIPGEIEVPAEGATSLREPRANLTMDLGNLLQIGTGDPQGKARIVFDGADLYVDPPKVPGLRIPGGGGWIAIDLRQIVEAMGIDADAAGAVFTVDPATQLRALQAAEEMEQVGTEDVRGVPTVHYKGEYSLEDIVETLPPARRDDARKAIEDLEALAEDDALDEPVPAELWVDAEGIAHRMRMSSKLPAQQGMPSGQMEIVYELHDFGAELDVSRPAGAKDLTDMIVRALKGQTVQ